MTALDQIAQDPMSIVMILLALLLLYLGIFKKYEPLLLIPIGFGVLIAYVHVINDINYKAILLFQKLFASL